MYRLINIKGNLIDLEYIYKIDIELPDTDGVNHLVKESRLVSHRESDLNEMRSFLTKKDDWKRTSALVYSVYTIRLYTFNKDQPDIFYFAHEDDFNKFMSAYKEYKKVSEILEF